MQHTKFIFSFLSTVTIDDQTYDGVGTSKKLARNEAAQNALSQAFNLVPLKPISKPKSPPGSTSDPPVDSNFGDFIAQ